MQRADMSRDYSVHDALGQRSIAEADFPLSIGGAENQGITLPGVEAGQQLAYLALSEGHAYIQPADKAPVIYLNEERIEHSEWLKSGDRIQIDKHLITWTVQGDKVQIEVDQTTPQISLRPPLQSPPANGTAPRNELPLETNRASATAPRRRILRYTLITMVLLSAAWLLLASSVLIDITPRPDSLSMRGFPPPLTLWQTRLALPGEYTIEAQRQGYRPLEVVATIGMGGTSRLHYSLQELPGLLRLNSAQSLQLQVSVDGEIKAFNAAGQLSLNRGTHQLLISARRYLPLEQSIKIQGLGAEQTLGVAMQPGWAEMEVSSIPAASTLSIDGIKIGRTPLLTEVMQGQHHFTLNLEGYQSFSLRREITAGKALKLADIELKPVDAQLQLQSRPAGATIRLNGQFQGTTPMVLALAANTTQQLQLSKAGYRPVNRTLKLKAAQEQSLEVRLKPEYGSLLLSLDPADASLLIDGQPADKTHGRLRLTTRPHHFEISKAGYVSETRLLTPRSGISQSIHIQLKTLQQQQVQKKAAATPAILHGPQNQSLRLIQPKAPFTMGASRREAGRRANENLRKVLLKRPFYLAEKEVSNAQYRQFKASHDSGTLDGAGLNGETQPVVNISWDDAARYCNWLSKQAKLPEAYVEKKGHMQAILPLNTGYRLPSEAEWAWVARIYQQPAPQRYPWSGGYPPTEVSGNYADAQIADTLADTIPNYDDGYRGSAPVGSYKARPGGFYDIGGNVSEWMHDYYALYPGQANTLITGPTGPANGEHHVVRGAGWRHGSISELRLSYRDYSKQPRADLGFRIGRYAE